MDLSLISANAQDFKAVKGLVFCGEPNLETEILKYTRDDKTRFYPGYIDLPGGDEKETDRTAFDTFQRELYEEFGVHVEAKETIYAVQHTGQPKTTDFLIRPSLFVVIALSRITPITAGDEGIEHGTMLFRDFLVSPDTIPAQVKLAQGFLEWFRLL